MACLTCFKLNEDCTCTNDDLEYGILERKCKELERQLTEAREENKQLEEWNKYTVKMFEASQRLASEMSQRANKEKERAEKAEHNLILQKNVNKTKSRLLEEERQENKRLREALENIVGDNYLWPDHREGNEYTPTQFASDVLAGTARLCSTEQALQEDKDE